MLRNRWSGLLHGAVSRYRIEAAILGLLALTVLAVAFQDRLITRTIDRLPAAVEAEHGPWLQEFLVQNATQLDPLLLGRIATRAIDTFDPDGVLRNLDYRARTRAFVFTPERMAAGYLSAYRYLIETRDQHSSGAPEAAEESEEPACVS